MRHPSEGVLRRLLDEPAGVADVDRSHTAGCSQCLAALAAMRNDAALVDTALAVKGGADIDLAAAWRRLSAASPAVEPVRTASPRRSRTREFLRRPAAAVLAAAVVLGGASAAAAGEWLPIFKTEQISAIRISTDDLVRLPDLSAYGDIELTSDPNVRGVVDAAAARVETGLDVPEVADLPRGVSGEPIWQVGDKASATFTFSAERAARAAADAGQALPPVPPGLDGSSVRLEAGPGVAQVWTSDAGAPGLVVGRAVAPTASSTGVPFETVRDYLLSLPGLPDELAEQLRTFTADGSTLPLPVPVDEVTSTSAEVNGRPATVLSTRDRAAAAVVWVDAGVVTVVAGALGSDEVLTVARELG